MTAMKQPPLLWSGQELHNLKFPPNTSVIKSTICVLDVVKAKLKPYKYDKITCYLKPCIFKYRYLYCREILTLLYHDCVQYLQSA